MDAAARGLRNAARLIEEGVLDGLKAARYSSWKDSQLGRWAARQPIQLRCNMAGHPTAARGWFGARSPTHMFPLPPLPGPVCRDIEGGAVGFEELERVALAQPDPFVQGLPSGGQELFEIWLSHYIR